jgi:hypothetical protein
LGLILVEFLAEGEKIGATMPSLSAPPGQNKSKLLDQVSDILLAFAFDRAISVFISKFLFRPLL